MWIILFNLTYELCWSTKPETFCNILTAVHQTCLNVLLTWSFSYITVITSEDMPEFDYPAVDCLACIVLSIHRNVTLTFLICQPLVSAFCIRVVNVKL